MRILMGTMSLIALAGCYNSETFQNDWVASTCEWYDHCDLLEVLDYTDTQDCMDEILSESVDGQTGDESCPDFDRSKAKECISELEAKSCDGGFNQPSSCLEACPEEL